MQTSFTHRKDRSGQRGQALVFLSLTALLMAFTLLTTFSIGKAIHERIATQQAADAVAYSEAVEEARAFNYYAYTNRAMAAHYVTVMAMYGHMSYVLAWDDYLASLIQLWGVDIPVELGVWAAALTLANVCPGGCGMFTSQIACLTGGEIQKYIDTYGSGNTSGTIQSEKKNVESNIPNIISGLHQEAEIEVQETAMIPLAQEMVHQAVFTDLSNSTMAQSLVNAYDTSGNMHNVDVHDANLVGMSVPQSTPWGATGKSAAGYCDSTAPVDPTGSTPAAVDEIACGSLNAATGANESLIRTEFTSANASRFQPMYGGDDFTRQRTVSPGSVLGLYGEAEQLIAQTGSQADVTFPGTSVGHGESRLIDEPNMPPKVCPNHYCDSVLGINCGPNCCSCCDVACAFSSWTENKVQPPGGVVPDPTPQLHENGETNEGGFAVAAHDHNGPGAFIAFAGQVIQDCQWFAIMPSTQSVGSWVYSVPQNNADGWISAYQNSSGFPDKNSQQGTVDLPGSDNVWPVSSSQTDNQGNTVYTLLDKQMDFRINEGGDNRLLLFNQPRTFAVVEESFSQANWGPFGLALDKAVRIAEPNAPQTYDNILNNASIKGRETIVAAASGLAYYHRPGSWREPPNFYNPFWRAKLHPFNQGEFAQLLEKVAPSGTYTGINSGDFLKNLPPTQ